MATRIAEVLLICVAFAGVALSIRPTLIFERDLTDNMITMRCRQQGTTLMATFLRNGDPVKENMTVHTFTISRATEGNYSCRRHDPPGMTSSRVQFAAYPEEYTGITPKVVYIRRGEVGELPCDYQPSDSVPELYSVTWNRNTLTTIDPNRHPHRGLSQQNFSVFLEANETQRQVNGSNYHCLVEVEGCRGSSACTGPSITSPPQSGAVIFVFIVDPPTVEVSTLTSSEFEVGQEAELTCTATGDNINSVSWMINGTACSIDTGCVDIVTKPDRRTMTNTVTLQTEGRLGKLLVECLVTQRFINENDNIVDPQNSTQLMRKIDFTETAETVILVTPAAEPSTFAAPSTLPVSTSTKRPIATPSIDPRTIEESSSSSDKTFKIVITAAAVTAAILLVLIITCGFVIVYRTKYRRKYPLQSEDASPDHVSEQYSEFSHGPYDSRSNHSGTHPIYEDIPLDGPVRKLSPSLFSPGNPEFKRQDAVPYDPFSGSFVFPYHSVDRWSQRSQETIYNTSQASGTSGTGSSSTYTQLTPGYLGRQRNVSPSSQTSLLRNEQLPHPRSPRSRSASRSPRPRSASRSPHRSASRSPGRRSLSRSPRHRRQSRSPTPQLTREGGHRSRSPQFPQYRGRSSRSPSPFFDMFGDTTRRPRSPFDVADQETFSSPSQPCSDAEVSPAVPLFGPPPSFLNPPYPPQGFSSPAARIDDRVLLTVLNFLMHEGDCPVPNCPCRALQQRCFDLQTRLARDGHEPAFDPDLVCAPTEKRHPTKLGLSTTDIRRAVEPHFHMAPKRATPKIPFKRQRSKSCDLTPIMEQRETPSPAVAYRTSIAGSGRDTPDDDDMTISAEMCNGPVTFSGRPLLLREISISADNVPSLCVNDCPITPSPLRFESRSLAAVSPHRELRARWTQQRFESVPEGHVSVASTTSNESNTSSRTANEATQSDREDVSDSEAVQPAAVDRNRQLPSVNRSGVIGKQMPLRRPVMSQESGYDSTGYASEGSQPGSEQLRRKRLGKVHEQHSVDLETVPSDVSRGIHPQGTLC